jgi:hypothetical protein
MKTIEIQLFKFNELSEAAKEKALEKLWDLNVDHDWWNDTYEDAKSIGLKITSFDLDRNRHANGEFIFEAKDVIDAILSNHGENCETYKTAENFKSQLFPLLEKELELEERDYDLEGEIADLEDEFLKSLLEDYSIILQKEQEYLTSEEAIKECIEANDYDFTEDGEIY